VRLVAIDGGVGEAAAEEVERDARRESDQERVRPDASHSLALVLKSW
jgi:hypothetical protein